VSFQILVGVGRRRDPRGKCRSRPQAVRLRHQRTWGAHTRKGEKGEREEKNKRPQRHTQRTSTRTDSHTLTHTLTRTPTHTRYAHPHTDAYTTARTRAGYQRLFLSFRFFFHFSVLLKVFRSPSKEMALIFSMALLSMSSSCLPSLYN